VRGAPLTGQIAVCPGCDGVTRLRRGIIVLYCTPNCGKRHRARLRYARLRHALAQKRHRERLRRIVLADPALAAEVLRAAHGWR
jgi:hypothetical protein